MMYATMTSSSSGSDRWHDGKRLHLLAALLRKRPLRKDWRPDALLHDRQHAACTPKQSARTHPRSSARRRGLSLSLLLLRER
jgi:hypothetical protein